MTTSRAIPALFATLALACAGSGALAQRGAGQPIGSAAVENKLPEQALGVDVVERLGERVPLGLEFVDSTGRATTLGDATVEGKPTVLAMVYYDCPVVCAVVMGQLTRAFRGIDFDIGRDYGVVFASIDPGEEPPLAASVKERYLGDYVSGADRPASVGEGWAFLTAPGESSRVLAGALGWNYKPIAGGEYSHPVCVFILSPDGTIARYVYGVGYEPETLRMALLEASEGKISASIGDKIRMFCYRFDPSTGKYSLQALRVVQLGAIASILSVGSLIGGLLIRERARKRRTGAGTTSHQAVPRQTP